jgi:hypothetical protein
MRTKVADFQENEQYFNLLNGAVCITVKFEVQWHIPSLYYVFRPISLAGSTVWNQRDFYKGFT